MQPSGLEGPGTFGRWPLLSLLLLLLLLQPVTCAYTTPGPPRALTTLGAPRAHTMPGTYAPSTTLSSPSTQGLQEQARALMRDFPLVDGSGQPMCHARPRTGMPCASPWSRLTSYAACVPPILSWSL
uniref:cDNA FLJ55113, moderately similar to Dipeptidase 2 n=1 Tax=Homo sapiens TaxID=9606 RepID=B4DNP7_HUMAN|nr:unnamed protein product [Homo sapiens]